MKSIALLVVFALGGIQVVAQKLPNIQQGSVKAPISIKIDGKADEWNNKFEAYNKATEAYYTICNDEQNIYFVFRSEKPDVNIKILMGGITLTLKDADQKQGKAISVTYPLLKINDLGTCTNALSREVRSAKDSSATVANINKPFAVGAKELEVAGLKGNTPQNISIYNEEGIQAKALFENGNHIVAYIYELAIPLKNFASAKLLAYTVKFNEPRKIEINGPLTAPPPPPVMINSTATTDFNGEYTLAK